MCEGGNQPTTDVTAVRDRNGDRAETDEDENDSFDEDNQAWQLGDPIPGEEEEDEEDYHIIRAKWTMDGARTLDEAIRKLRVFISYLKALKREGWELRDPVQDDYGFLNQRRAPGA